MKVHNVFRLLVAILCVIHFASCDAEISVITPADDPTETPSGNENEQETDDPKSDEEIGNEENTDNSNTEEEGEENRENGEDEENNGNDDANDDNNNGNTTIEGATYPEPDYSITPWSGLTASDSGNDMVGSDKDLYHELNTFTNLVVVCYEGTKAIVSSSNSDIIAHVEGAHVVLDMSTKGVSGVEVVAVGSTTDGSLKVYSNNKYRLSLYGVDITSQRGPAINSQAGKRVYVNLAAGTTNRLTDCATYSSDIYTMPGAIDEDRKGAFFTEGHMIISGNGTLVVAGKMKHGIVTDGYYYQRPGSTVVVTEAAKNCIHVKGDSDDNMGVQICGGAITANATATAGKGIKCDMDIVIAGGKLNITTSGNATYDSDSKDTSSASCLKSDTNINIKGGTLNLNSSGTGGKGLSADANIIFDGGVTNISTTGGQYKYSSQLTSSPKGIRADGNITINNGDINISVTGKSEGSEGLESKDTITFNGGNTTINSYDDGINASKAMIVNGGRIYAMATNNDGIDSNGTITINGGVFIGIGSGNPEGGIDVDNDKSLFIHGGTVIGIGGGMMGKPSTSSTQYSVVYGGASVSTSQRFALLDPSNNMLFSYESPITMSATVLFSTPDIKNGTTYTVSSGGSASNYTENWQGWCYDGTWSGGTTLTTFTPSSVVTSIGNSGGGGPGGGGGGNWPGGGGWPR